MTIIEGRVARSFGGVRARNGVIGFRVHGNLTLKLFSLNVLVIVFLIYVLGL